MRVQHLKVDQLRPHESTEEGLLKELIVELREERGLEVPIVVDQETLVILDGHHRHAAYQALGIERIPCILVNYRSPSVRVEARRPEIPVSKEEVLRRGLQGDLYPPKTTRHIFLECETERNPRSHPCFPWHLNAE